MALPMRILHVVPSYLPATRYGGPIYSVHALCVALARAGHDVHVYTTNVDGPGVSAVPVGRPVDLDGVRVTYFATGLGRRLYRSPAMARALEDNAAAFDVVHLHSVFLWPTAKAASVARRRGVPYVLAPRGMLVGDLIRRKSSRVKQAWINLIERRNLAGAAAIHVTSEIEAAEIRSLGLPMRRVAVIPNGIELPPAAHAAPTTLRRHPATATPHSILSLGRINWKKGLDRLIPAMVHVPGAHLIIAGNDEESYQPKLAALAIEHGVADRIRFVGAVHGDEKWRLIRAADLFVLPSYNENFGNVVLEAMACGVPVVVTPEVGLAPAVRDTGSGIVSAGDPASLGHAIAELLGDGDRRRRMGDRALAAARENFSWRAIGQTTSALYRELARKRSDEAA